MKHSYAEQHPDVDELIASHTELVRKIAWQIHGRARHITEIEDMMQIGYTGLIIAAQNYTLWKGPLLHMPASGSEARSLIICARVPTCAGQPFR